MQSTINISHALAGVKYEIRGRLSRRAYELERQGYEIISLNIGNPGLFGISVSEVFIGNGVSELIDLSLRALLNPGDEVLVPSPDYPLWSAAVTLNGGKTVHYPCSPVSRSIFPRPTTLPGCAKPPTNI